ncbi:conserved hypothetical protein [methanotrophic bacterial endosymbiont of Bathymodiolus sp.]|nr:conserved hypothetical protein [methanotrophic bacterial endosymbiont of Bathymodiolus sp.]
MDVFPTPVGVFLCVPTFPMLIFSLPHARGGVSTTVKEAEQIVSSSPRPWGCF